MSTKSVQRKICRVGNCENVVKTKGLCNKHYTQVFRWGHILTAEEIHKHHSDASKRKKTVNVGVTCQVDGCENPAKTRRYCNKHYLRIWKYGCHAMTKEESTRRRRAATQKAAGQSITPGYKWGDKVTKQQKKLVAIGLLGGECAHCGLRTDQLCVYDFHHINPGEKDTGVTNLLESGWKKIEKELKKCILLCANCHRIEHHGDDQAES